MALPEEGAKPGTCALLKRAMHDTRDAPAASRDDHLDVWRRGVTLTGVPVRPSSESTGENETAGRVHCDDFAVLSDDKGLDAMEVVLGGPDSHDDKECCFLNRIFRHSKGISNGIGGRSKARTRNCGDA